ncbi:MAG TPA: hypothetical protein VF407_01465 [Polyangiaceae bacterium]
MRSGFVVFAPLAVSLLAVLSPVGCSSAAGAGFADGDDAGARATTTKDGGTSGPGADAGGGSDSGSSDVAKDGGTASGSDAGPSTDAGAEADAGADTDAGMIDVDAGSDAGTTTTSTSKDPFDATACAGPPITFAQAAAKFASGASTASLGSYELMVHTRTCTAVSGCSAWTTPVQALAYRAHGNTTGDFPLGGAAYLEVAGSTISAEFADSSNGPGAESLEFLSTATSGPIDFAKFDHGYMYTALYELYVPPIPQTEEWGAAFTVNVTDHCATAVSDVVVDSVSSTQTQWGALLRY